MPNRYADLLVEPAGADLSQQQHSPLVCGIDKVLEDQERVQRLDMDPRIDGVLVGPKGGEAGLNLIQLTAFRAV